MARSGRSALFAILVVLGTGAKAAAAVAVDATSTGHVRASTLTLAHTVGSGSNRLLIVGVSTGGGKTVANVSSITYGGVALTQVATITNTGSADLWRLVAPASGTANIVVTMSASDDIVVGAVSFSGVSQGAPLGAVVRGSANSTTPSVTVQSRTGDLVFDVVQTDSNTTLTAGAGQTQQWNALQGKLSGGSTEAWASSVTMSWTIPSANWSQVGANVRAAGVNSGTLLSGSYTGNATDDTAISAQLGFEPAAVFVKGETTQEAVVRTVTMNGDRAKPMSSNTALTANLIQSFEGIVGLSQGGFTVGTDARVNSNTLTYDYVALTSKAGEVFVGSYIGNGVDNTSITGAGFQPDVVMIFADSPVAAVFRTSTMAGDKTVQFNNIASFNDCIQAMQSDGFQVGTDTQCNGLDVQYHYVAWKATAGKLAVGSYTGVNPQDDRNIALAADFGTPDWVILNTLTAVDGVQKMAATDKSIDMACYFRNIVCSADAIQALQTNGFQVGTKYNVNAVVYHYIAFSHQSAVTAIKLASFTATRGSGAETLLRWQTGYEVDNLGFNLYREERGARTRVNPGLIRGSALLAAPGTAMTAGFSYQWLDPTPIVPNATVTYWLEDVDLNGTRTLHGPIVPVAGTWKSTEGAPSVLLRRVGKPAGPTPGTASSDSTPAR